MRRIFFCWIAVLGLLGSGLSAFAQTVCAGTPAAAINRVKGDNLPAAEGKGYRVTGVRKDTVLNQRWATITNCEHPEWPEFSVRTSAMNAAPRLPVAHVHEERLSGVPVVHAGDIVHLWRREDLLRIEVIGVAEESGSLGKTIRVRLLRRNTDDQSTERQFTGIVRGVANVEIQR